jgi:UDP-N-acetylglucosamine 2-epimerase
MKIINVVGARPNLVKIAPLLRAMRPIKGIQPVLLHTGQHYDEKLSDIFFRQMNIGEPDINLGVGSGSHASQTAEILKRIEPVLLEQRPDLVLVDGLRDRLLSISPNDCTLCQAAGLSGKRVDSGIPGATNEEVDFRQVLRSQNGSRS